MTDSNKSEPTTPASSASSPKPSNGLALTALILGGASVLLAFIPLINVVGGLAGLAAIVLGIIALARKQGKVILGALGLGLGVLGGILSIVMGVVYTLVTVTAVGESISSGSSQSVETPASAAPEESAEVGTRANPAPIGTAISSDEWEVTLGPVTLDATAAVMDANMFNDPPPEGFVYALVPVTVTYTGDTSATPWVDINVQYVSADGVTYTTSDSNAVSPEPRFLDINELYTGASASGNIVIAIPSATAAAGTWTVSAGWGGTPYFFAAQ
jgi:hypothetical protein